MDMKRAECTVSRETIQELKDHDTELENTLYFLQI